MSTSFQNGGFINKLDAISTWRNIRKFWIYLEAGAPDYIHTDVGIKFNAKHFKARAEKLGTIVPVAPTEDHN